MARLQRTRGVLLVVWTLGSLAQGQEPQSPPPPSGASSNPGTQVLELLPDLGKIGAQVGALAGATWNPYDNGQGYGLTGFIDLPLFRAPGGKISYEILLGVSDANDSRLRLLDTSPFGLKYTLTGLDHARLRPYLDGGLEVVLVVIDRAGLRFPGTGNSNLEVGFHAGGGLEVRVSRGVSLNLDYRFSRLGSADLHVVGGGLGFHF
jgi:Outer membrane protein beta-barrel domain